VRAALISAPGEPPAVAELRTPEPGPGEALVRIHAASLNPVELHIWSGRFFDGPPRFPYVPGVEGAGVVESGDRLEAGTRVRVEFVHPGYGRDGAIAEYAVAPEVPDASDRSSQAMVFPLPEGVDDVRAAALGTSGYTALMLLERAVQAGAELRGAHVLVLAATGAVGQCAVQLARGLGAARVVAAGRDEARLEGVRALGADATVRLDTAPGELRERFVEAANGRLDVVLDPLWGAPARAAMEALGEGGVLVNFGHVTSPTAELPSLPLRNRRVTLVGHSGAWTTPEQRRSAFERLHSIAAETGLTLGVDELSLDEVPEGWRRLQDSAGRKLVVRPGG
jgi:NADPH:quinone reductase-like Zn-dependent oxidoreductase